jgi:hypothetical protein
LRKLHKFFRILSLLTISLLPICSFASPGVFFSSHPKLISPLLAASRDPQVKMSFLKSKKGEFFEPAFGGDLNIYNLDCDVEENQPKAFSLSARMLVASRFEFGSGSFDLWNTDFLGGPQLSYVWKTHGLEAWFYHESSHKGPDITARTGPSKNYSFEAVRLLYSEFFASQLRLYGGVETIVHGDPKEIDLRTSFRVGGDWHLQALKPELYIATDIEAKQVHGWTPNASLQIGYELGDLTSLQKRQHLFVNFFHGYSPQGQFYKDRETAISLGIAMTL